MLWLAWNEVAWFSAERYRVKVLEYALKQVAP
jgi:hypothetical protein